MSSHKEVWLISAPGDPRPEETYRKVVTAFQRTNICETSRFNIPTELKVGTLDTLVELSDELAKQDSYMEGVVRKLASVSLDVLEARPEEAAEYLKVKNMPVERYCKEFRWDAAKYPLKNNLKEITERISKEVGKIDTELKTKHGLHNSIKASLQTMERKQTGSLLTRFLGDIVKKDDFILGSDYLTTVCVVVPKSSFSEWHRNYETMVEEKVVPRSSKLTFEDNEFGLFTVSLFKTVLDEFKYRCREKKFIVRDFVYDEKELQANKKERAKLVQDKQNHHKTFIPWLRVQFGECFAGWLHIKTLRVFVESVLRFGLPVNFASIVIEPQPKSNKKVKDVLFSLFSHLDSRASSDDSGANEMPQLGFVNQEYYPYVFYSLKLDFLHLMK